LIHFPGGEFPDRLYSPFRNQSEGHDISAQRPEIVEDLRRKLDEAWKQMRPAPESGAGELDEETRKRLEALGYL
jgi:hypothetical protein